MSTGEMAERFDGGSARRSFIPFYGWERTTLVGLIAAVSPLDIEDVEKYAGSSVDFAEDYLRPHGGTDPLGLDLEEIASLNLYTKANVAWPERSFYAVLNRTLNDKDRKKIVPFFPYLRLFFGAVQKSENACA